MMLQPERSERNAGKHVNSEKFTVQKLKIETFVLAAERSLSIYY